ncbi:MAG TPA: ATP-dependent sacrificial sulfur transferase LarE [Candidatus Polarisedimenticolia bacterium]|nr:ATP-dependent sacrificial sulfur transferase LarE [Candidatus Polarisedimenticolia bacterium]
MDASLRRLRGILRQIGPCVVAFSGGVDSTLLLRVAHDVLGDGAIAATAVSPSLSRSEKREAIALARLIGAHHLLIRTRELDDPRYVANDGRRCYFCKKELFRVLRPLQTRSNGRPVVYGAIVDDLKDVRPGMQAANEAGARAPLLEAGLDKNAVRALSRRLGLPTWDKPAMACLASRLPLMTPVTADALALVDRAEQAVRALGYRQVRVRHHGRRARIELDAEGLTRAAGPAHRRALLDAVVGAGFADADIDPRGYRPSGGDLTSVVLTGSGVGPGRH